MANLGLPEPDFESELDVLPMIMQEELNFDKSALCDRVFERGIDENYGERLWMSSRAIITPTNKAAEEVNTVVISKFLRGDSKTYRSCDTLHENENEFPVELINDRNPSGFPPYVLVLKKHSSIMLLRNLDAAGHCNGTRYIVLNLHNHITEAEVANGTHAGIRIMIPRISLTTTKDYPFSFSRKQFPVKPAFGMTSNKSQGLDKCSEKAGIYLPTPVFSHSQFYVANSRVGFENNVHILALASEYKGRKRIYTDNVVYKEIL
ncbi:ATP-dependent DNA helicase PIF1-like [Octopus vulgaris]|uniref:ATP-dependent DNA helicase PIF1-like n=1 Tax=Octopus vulgaris TaxID=6645 RepID=A0AA36ATG4_OCTVU|nr:ATP-dependent DNA helicase PIF1-like [Octopus vulgaris]